MRPYELDGTLIDLDEVAAVGQVFINKNYPEFNCFEVYQKGGKSYSLFVSQITRDEFVALWQGGQ